MIFMYMWMKTGCGCGVWDPGNAYIFTAEERDYSGQGGGS